MPLRFVVSSRGALGVSASRLVVFFSWCSSRGGSSCGGGCCLLCRLVGMWSALSSVLSVSSSSSSSDRAMLCLLRRRGALLVSSSVAFLVAAAVDAVLRLRLSDPRGRRFCACFCSCILRRLIGLSGGDGGAVRACVAGGAHPSRRGVIDGRCHRGDGDDDMDNEGGVALFPSSV